MIDLYTFGTGNGRRASIALEECGLAYRAHKIDIAKGEQNAPAFRALNPLGRVPVIVDPEGPAGAPLTLNESGAILLYCAEKAGRFLPTDPHKRFAALRWVFHAVSDAGEPIAAYYRLSRLGEKAAPALAFYAARFDAILQGVDAYLADRTFLVDDVSIADLGFYTVAAHAHETGALERLPNLQRWFKVMSERPGVARGMAVPG